MNTDGEAYAITPKGRLYTKILQTLATMTRHENALAWTFEIVDMVFDEEGNVREYEKS